MEIIWKTIQLSCLFFSFAEFFVQDKRFFSERLWGESGWNYVECGDNSESYWFLPWTGRRSCCVYSWWFCDRLDLSEIRCNKMWSCPQKKKTIVLRLSLMMCTIEHLRMWALTFLDRNVIIYVRDNFSKISKLFFIYKFLLSINEEVCIYIRMYIVGCLFVRTKWKCTVSTAGGIFFLSCF